MELKPPHIDSYRFGLIVVDDQAYNKDLILLPDGVTPNWWRESGHNLTINDLGAILEALPEVLVVGQGSVSRMKVPPETQQAIQEAGIELIVLSTSEACQRYNELSQERRTAAALHLTC
jgi:hypothetical protein